jgi:glycosyltransferase involved in cell wall biosynthesis
VAEQHDIRNIVDRYEAIFHSVVALNAKTVKNKLSDQRDALLRERDRFSAELERVSSERRQLLNVQESLLKEMSQRLQKGEEQINEIRHLVETQHQQLDKRIDYVLMRLSVKERVKERFYKLLKSIHRLVPKKFREKYRYQYRRFFFDKVFPDKERFEQSAIPSMHLSIPVEDEIERFLDFVEKNGCQKLFAIYAADPYIESQGQRSTWLVKEFVQRGIPVILFYWRWDKNKPIAKSPDPQIFSVPIDEFSKIEKPLFSFSPNGLKKIFLIEFPDSFLFEKINIANAHCFVTVYDCIDDWEHFAKVGQAIWYDAAVERYLVRNTDLIIATNSLLAEKMKKMGAASVPIIPNGVDMGSFQQKLGSMRLLERGTITIGYFGHLADSWFDWDLVLKTALRNKDWFFHIIGYGEPSGLKLPENVRFWGRVEHGELPCFTRSWDVAIIPFKEGRLTEAVDAIKLYEYLFLGLPVVATNMPHLQGIPGVFPCKRNQFEQTLVLAKETPFNRDEVERFVENNTWRKRVDRLLEEIDQVDFSRDPLKAMG